jgi:hypothetical protein
VVATGGVERGHGPFFSHLWNASPGHVDDDPFVQQNRISVVVTGMDGDGTDDGDDGENHPDWTGHRDNGGGTSVADDDEEDVDLGGTMKIIGRWTDGDNPDDDSGWYSLADNPFVLRRMRLVSVRQHDRHAVATNRHPNDGGWGGGLTNLERKLERKRRDGGRDGALSTAAVMVGTFDDGTTLEPVPEDNYSDWTDAFSFISFDTDPFGRNDAEEEEDVDDNYDLYSTEAVHEP